VRSTLMVGCFDLSFSPGTFLIFEALFVGIVKVGVDIEPLCLKRVSRFDGVRGSLLSGRQPCS
jgi:hypothetical protein